MMRKAWIFICIAFFAVSLAFVGCALLFVRVSAATDAVDSCCVAPIDTSLPAGCAPGVIAYVFDCKPEHSSAEALDCIPTFGALASDCGPANIPAHRVIIFDTASVPGQGITPPCCELPTRPRGGCCPGSFDLQAGFVDILFSRSGMFYEERLRLLPIVDFIFRPPEI